MSDLRIPAVRFAPSPTGPLHIGNMRTALYNHLFSKQVGGRCILRIEDTDQTRFVQGAEEYIIEALSWLGVEFTEGPHVGGDVGPYRQSERVKEGLYQKYADQLLESGYAYVAFDTAEELEQMRADLKAEGHQTFQYNYASRLRMKNSLTLGKEEVEARIAAGEPFVLRMKMPRKEEIRFQDKVRGWVVFHSSQLDDKILLKSDGFPTYHLANVVDDYLMGITHVIRGEEWLSSTPLHMMLYKAFGWEDRVPSWIHLPLILNPNGKGKMSKRQGDKLGFSVYPTNWTDPASGKLMVGYREQGYLPETMMNFLALLGWNPGNDEEVMNEARLIEAFSIDRFNNSGSIFDLDKLKWFNQTYIRSKKPEELLSLVKIELDKAELSCSSDEYLLKAIELMQERVSVIPEFISQAKYLFEAPASYDEKTVRKRWSSQAQAYIGELLTELEGIDNWKSDEIQKCFQIILQKHELGMGRLMAPLRLLLTGIGFGPGIFDISELLGKKETINRIRKGLEVLIPQK